MFKKIYIDSIYIYRNFKALTISIILHLIIFTGLLLFWSEKNIVETQKLQVRLAYLQPEEPILKQPIQETEVIEQNIPVKTEIERTVSKPPERPAPKTQTQQQIKPVREKTQVPVKTPQRQKNVKPSVKPEPAPQPKKERIVIDRQPKQEIDMSLDDLIPVFDQPDIDYNSERPIDMISDRNNIISERLLTEHTPASRIEPVFEYEESEIISPNNNIIIDDIIREGINFDRETIIEFDKLKPVNTEKPEFISTAFYVTENANIQKRKLLKNPDMPAPDWLEEQGISTHIVFDGIINEHGKLIKADIIQMSPYYKLDIAARDFVMKNWLWEQANYSQQVRIQLVVDLKR